MEWNEVSHGDPHFLFPWLLIASDNFQLEEIFQYELCTYPTALFRFPIHVTEVTIASASRCTLDRAYTRSQYAA